MADVYAVRRLKTLTRMRHKIHGPHTLAGIPCMRRIAVFKLWLRCQCDVLQGSKERYGRILITLTRSVAALLAGMLRMWCMAVLGLTASHRPSEAMTMRAPFSGSVTCRTSGSDVTAEPACEKATCQDLHSLFVSHKLWLLSECDNQPHYDLSGATSALCLLLQQPGTSDHCALIWLIGCHSRADAWSVPVMKRVQALHAAAAERS